MSPMTREHIWSLVHQASNIWRLNTGERRELCALLAGVSMKESSRLQLVGLEIVRTRRKALYKKSGCNGKSAAHKLVAKVCGLETAMDAFLALCERDLYCPRCGTRCGGNCPDLEG
jgi:hypothetical protein